MFNWNIGINDTGWYYVLIDVEDSACATSPYINNYNYLFKINVDKKYAPAPDGIREIEKPITGLIAGGPDMLRSDEYSRWLIPKNTPPAKCYIDVQYSYSTNETAIFWNSPAIFVLSHFNRKKYKTDKATDTK